MKKNLFLLCVFIFSIVSCNKKSEPINLELEGFPEASCLIGPGLGTLGVIKGSFVYTHYLTSDREWKLDRLSTFVIPAGAEGVLALGMGYLGVLNDNTIKIYYLDNDSEWKKFEGADFEIPSRYKRLFGVKFSYEMGMIALENNGNIFFYYLDEDLSWKLDETATFGVPDNTRQVCSLGNNIMGMVVENDVLFAYLNAEENKWEVDYEFSVHIPSGFEAVEGPEIL